MPIILAINWYKQKDFYRSNLPHRSRTATVKVLLSKVYTDSKRNRYVVIHYSGGIYPLLQATPLYGYELTLGCFLFNLIFRFLF